jgi:hypothetical protein
VTVLVFFVSEYGTLRQPRCVATWGQAPKSTPRPLAFPHATALLPRKTSISPLGSNRTTAAVPRHPAVAVSRLRKCRSSLLPEHPPTSTATATATTAVWVVFTLRQIVGRLEQEGQRRLGQPLSTTKRLRRSRAWEALFAD